MKTVVVIPTYNEIENIGILIEEIFELDIDLHILVVDDNSPDGTAQAVKSMQQKYDNLDLIVRSRKSGLGSAYIAGFKRALDKGVQLICEMDADGSHNPKEITQMIAEFTDNEVDLVIGSRYIEGGQIHGWNLRRHLTSRLAIGLSRFVLRLKTRDVTAGFRCYKRRVLDNIDLDKIHSNGYAFQEEILYLVERKGFYVKEIPVVFMDRKRGKSKLSAKDAIEFFATLFRLKFGNHDK